MTKVMKKLIIAGMALMGCLAAEVAQSAIERSEAWQKGLAAAVSDGTKASEAIQQISEGDRAAFAADVLEHLSTKPVADDVWNKEYAATAVALVSGAGSAKAAVLKAVANAELNIGVSADAREQQVPIKVTTLLTTTEVQLGAEDRTAFANATIKALESRKYSSDQSRKYALISTSFALIAGAGSERKTDVIAEVFATAPAKDMGTLAAAITDGFNQAKLRLNNDDFRQIAQRVLQSVSTRVSGQSDAVERFSYAVGAFVGAAKSPAAFQTTLLSRIGPDMLARIGTSSENLAAKVEDVKADLVANASYGVVSLMQAMTAELAGKDRVAFAAEVLKKIIQSSELDAATRKALLTKTAFSLVSGAGDRRDEVVAEVYALSPASDLGAISAAMIRVFDQQKNELSDDEYQRNAKQALLVTANRLSGLPDAATRFSYAIEALALASESGR